MAGLHVQIVAILETCLVCYTLSLQRSIIDIFVCVFASVVDPVDFDPNPESGCQKSVSASLFKVSLA